MVAKSVMNGTNSIVKYEASHVFEKKKSKIATDQTGEIPLFAMEKYQGLVFRSIDLPLVEKSSGSNQLHEEYATMIFSHLVKGDGSVLNDLPQKSLIEMGSNR